MILNIGLCISMYVWMSMFSENVASGVSNKHSGFQSGTGNTS